jgi:Patatin-like phospholipase
LTQPANDQWKLWGPLADRYRRAARGGDPDFRLCDFFDLIGGTGTGAIIAAGLARGMSVDEITSFYHDFGRKAFERRKLFMRWKSLYGDGDLAKTLQQTFGRQGRQIQRSRAAGLQSEASSAGHETSATCCPRWCPRRRSIRT